MVAEGWDVEGVTEQWENNYKSRKIIQGFMKDKEIGAKRLASMPDRVTNTMNVLSGGQASTLCRPTVINMYEGDLSTIDKWWSEWKQFMFHTEVEIKTKTGVTTSNVCSLLDKIKHSKYPAITPEEEAISIPLQTLCQAVFDSVLIHMLNTLAPEVWTTIKSDICDKLSRKKNPRTLEIIEKHYGDRDVLFLQEVAANFADRLEGSSTVTASYHVVKPAKMDGKRDQNSILLLRKALFDVSSLVEVTEEVVTALKAKEMVMDGDILGITVKDKEGEEYFLASFHGDTNGLATIPVMEALQSVATTKYAGYTKLWGLDANAHFTPDGGKRLSVEDMSANVAKLGLAAASGLDLPEEGGYTTYNARTYLQSQLNKACRADQIREQGDVHPKDFVIFEPERFELASVTKDNTGEGRFIQDIVFPTMTFPSDHCVLACDLQAAGAGKSAL